MKISCGILIVNEFNEIFVGHSTGNKFYDIPKGGIDENESPINCAIRECQEETSLIFNSNELKDLGEFAYNKEKKLHLFLTFKNKNDINLSALTCNSFFEHYTTKKLLPECDSFTWINFNEIEDKCAKSMSKLLLKMIESNLLSNNKCFKPK